MGEQSRPAKIHPTAVVATTAEGRRLWMFLETASGRWFVHGEWA